MDYLEFYNLKEDPFGLTPDSSYFYPSKMHNEVLSSIDYAVEQKEGFSLITGEPGTGKTTVLKIFIDRWKDRAEIALIMTPRLSAEEILQAILDDFNIHLLSTNKNEIIKTFRDFLIERSMTGKRVVIIVDEAQNLSREALEELRLLSNLETEKEKLLQIILVGQPELKKVIRSDRLKQLDQRITIRTALRPLLLSETSDYINFRLVKAGKGSVVFEERAIKAVYRFSRGIPRLVNLIASRAMMVAYINTSHKVGKEHVQDAVKHLSDVSAIKSALRSPAFYVLSALLLLAAGAASVPLYEAYIQDLAFGRFISRNAGLVISRHEVAAIPKVQHDIDKNRRGSDSAVRTDKANTTKSDALLKNQKKSATVIVKWARLRQRPSLHADKISVAYEGDAFDILEEWTEINGNKWYKVNSPGSEGLWIAAHLVEVKSRHQ